MPHLCVTQEASVHMAGGDKAAATYGLGIGAAGARCVPKLRSSCPPHTLPTSAREKEGRGRSHREQGRRNHCPDPLFPLTAKWVESLSKVSASNPSSASQPRDASPNCDLMSLFVKRAQNYLTRLWRQHVEPACPQKQGWGLGEAPLERPRLLWAS